MPEATHHHSTFLPRRALLAAGVVGLALPAAGAAAADAGLLSADAGLLSAWSDYVAALRSGHTLAEMEAAERIQSQPAQTVAGVGAKLRVAFIQFGETDGHAAAMLNGVPPRGLEARERLLWDAIADLDRMAAQG